jgi:hypothetical protein
MIAGGSTSVSRPYFLRFLQDGAAGVDVSTMQRSQVTFE